MGAKSPKSRSQQSSFPLRPLSLVYASILSCSVVSELMDDSQPGFSVHGIIRARILEWVVIFSSRGCSWPRDHTCLSCVLLLLWQLDSLPLSHLGSFLLEEDGRLLPVFSHSLPSVCVYVQISSSHEDASFAGLGPALMVSFLTLSALLCVCVCVCIIKFY